jgi:hypothetical protein
MSTAGCLVADTLWQMRFHDHTVLLQWLLPSLLTVNACKVCRTTPMPCICCPSTRRLYRQHKVSYCEGEPYTLPGYIFWAVFLGKLGHVALGQGTLLGLLGQCRHPGGLPVTDPGFYSREGIPRLLCLHPPGHVWPHTKLVVSDVSRHGCHLRAREVGVGWGSGLRIAQLLLGQDCRVTLCRVREGQLTRGRGWSIGCWDSKKCRGGGGCIAWVTGEKGLRGGL